MSSAEGFFQFHGVDNFLLEDHQAPMDSIAQCCLCKRGHKKSESSKPMEFSSYHGYLPEIEEELSMPFSYSQRRNEISPFNDEELSYIAHSQGSQGRGRNTLNNDLKFGFSDSSIVGIRSSVGLPYISRNTDELVMGRNISESFQRIDLGKEHLMISSPSHFTLQTRPRDGRKMLLYAHQKIRCNAQEKFDVYDGRISLVDPMSGSRNLRNQGTQSPGFDVQYFRNNHGVLVPTFIQPKQTLSNSASELPSRFSTTSISSDETEHAQIKVGLYKTELCRSWEETGYCRYAAKCQVMPLRV
jgi:butyrate response factor 1